MLRNVTLGLGLGVACFAASGTSFTPGSIVAYRVGNGTSAVGASADPVFLDEYGPNGTLLQSIALPTAAGSAPLTNPLTASSTGSEGLMMRTIDGTCITMAGYASAVGTANVGTGTGLRDVGFVTAAGAVDTTTSLGSTAFSGSNVRGAVSDTCGHAWISGNGTAKANYGVWYATKGATSATQLVQTNAQGIAISNGQLYASFSSSTFDTVGTGLPTTGTQNVTAVSANIVTTNYRGVVFLQLQAGSSGSDTLYLADNVNNLITKYSYNGSTWVALGGLSTAAISGINTHGLTAANLGDGIVALYFTSSKGGIIYQAFDTSGPTGTLASNTPYAAFATAAGQPTNAVYYGLAPSPETSLPTAVPNAPTNANATNVTSSSFTANWTAPGAGAQVDYYAIDLSYNASFAPLASTTLVAANATSVNFSGLTNPTAYYRVRAVNDVGASADAVSGINVAQTIMFGQAPAVTVGGTSTLVATASSGLPVAFGSTTPNVCTVSGNVVTGVSVGACTVTADQAGNNEYNAAPEATQVINVVSAVQTQSITFGAAPASMVVGGSGTVSATASSGLAVTFTSQTTGICTVSGSTVTGVATGTCTVAGDQAGNANYYAAPEVTQSFEIGQGSQTISFGSAPSVVYGGTGALSASASSGLAVTFTSQTTGICTVSGSTVTGVNVGTCMIAANQAGNGNYLPAPQLVQSFAVGGASQTISFSSLPQVLVGGSATLSASATSGLAVSFSSNTPAVCAVNGNAVSAVATGSCVIAADQSGNADYLAASTVTQSFVIANPLSAFTAGSLVISSVSGLNNGGADLDTASPIALQQFQLSSDGTIANLTGAMLLPQAGAAQPAISGEFGSASEGHIELSVNGQYLAMIGYGVDAQTFNSAPSTTYGTAALGQTTSLTAANQTGTVVTTVPRTVALVGINTSVDTSTQLTGVYNQNNPRSVATVDGTAFWTSGQGASKGDPTEGVAYAPIGASTATMVDNSTETRVVEILNTGSGNTLYVSRDLKPATGANDFTNVGTLTDANGNLPLSATGLVTTQLVPPASPLSLGGNNASINLTAATANGVNNARIGSFVYLSPEQYFLASPTVMYVADSGEPKDGSANAAGLGEGGLQKWILVNGSWTLAYDLVDGLNLVNNANANSATPTAPGVTGLLSLTGRVVAGRVQLFATTYGLNELSQSYLVEISDNLSATSISQVSNEQFTVLYSDATGQTAIRGVSFAPGVLQTINPGTVPATLTVGGNATLGATASSGLPVTYTSLTSSVCTISGSNLSAVGAGTCTIAIDQAGNGTYMPAIEVDLNVTVGASQQSQTITFGSAPNVSVGGTGTLAATATSGLAVTFTSQTASVCTVSASTVTGVSAGTCTVAADQAGNSQYSAAPEVTQSFAVAAQSQTIAFGTAPSVTVGGAGTLSATATSGLIVTFSSQTPAVCTVSGNTVTGVSAGTCTIAADQAGNSQYGAAPEVTQSFAVAAGTGGSGSDSGDVPLPAWAYALLGLALLETLRRNSRVRK